MRRGEGKEDAEDGRGRRQGDVGGSRGGQGRVEESRARREGERERGVKDVEDVDNGKIGEGGEEGG